MFLTKLFNVKSKIRNSASVQIKFSIRLNFAHAVEDYRGAKVWPEEAPLQYSMAFSSCILATIGCRVDPPPADAHLFQLEGRWKLLSGH